MKLQETLDVLPATYNGVVIVLSGGLDSTTSMRLAVEKYGANKVHAITFDYGQRQAVEIERARESTALLDVSHRVIDMSFYGQINEGFSANVKGDVAMPTIKDILGDPQPKTYLSHRNLVMFSIVAAYAETCGVNYVICGVQSTDGYAYWDTSVEFIQAVNNVLSLNRKSPVTLIAPFNKVSKTDELNILYSLDSNLDLLKHTITCYNPNTAGESCGNCPSCSERIKAFQNIKQPDPVKYSVEINWN
jgi:7-cyano-7-deazaguanine synthase